MGFGPRYRLYATLDGWLCIAAVRDEHWRALCIAIGQPELVETLDGDALAIDPGGRVRVEDCGRDWFEVLDAHGVPCEVSSETWGEDWFDDPDVIANGWVTDYTHDIWGRFEQPGRFFDFSDTPSRIAGTAARHRRTHAGDPPRARLRRCCRCPPPAERRRRMVRPRTRSDARTTP